MSWTNALKRKALSVDVHEQICKFLKHEIPAFKAPKDAKQWPRDAKLLRQRAIEEVYLHGYPKRLLTQKPSVKWGQTIKPKGAPYTIRKLRYECYPDYWIPALLYEPKRLTGKTPVVLNPNGHHRGGKAADYKQARCANLARRGMIALNFEFIGQSELEADYQHNQLAYISMTGMAGVGLFYLAMSKGLDVLLAHKNADKSRVCMTGLSGGGWQTIVLSALDERITVSVPVAGYTALRSRIGCLADIGDYEQCPPDLTTVADYDCLTAMLAPRPTLQICNAKDDCCFRTERTKPVIHDAVKPTFKAMGAEDDFEFYSNHDPGTHNYEADNRQQLYRFLNKHFGLDTPETDQHKQSEIYPECELAVGLPNDQQTITGIAVQRAIEVSGKLKTPSTAYQRKQLRRELETVIRLPEYSGRFGNIKKPYKDKNLQTAELTAGPWKLPMTFRLDSKTKLAQLCLSDHGRWAFKRIDESDRSDYAIDLLGFGEMADTPRQNILIEAAGQRLLGINVAQMLAAVEAICKKEKLRKIDVHADGRASSVITMIAAALKPKLFSTIRFDSALQSLKYLAQWQYPYELAQPLFCPDLLTVADIPQITSLMEGVTIQQTGRAVVDYKVPSAN